MADQVATTLMSVGEQKLSVSDVLAFEKIHANLHFDNRNRSYKTLVYIWDVSRAKCGKQSVFWRSDFRYPNQIDEK